MEYYSSETCFMEELLLVKDMEFYPNIVEDFINLDSCLATTSNNIISSSNAHCFEDYCSNIQTFNFPAELGLGEFTHEHSPNANYLNTSQLDDFRSSIVAPCPVFNEIKGSKMKKVNGQPSKNLMAERRRRKRLNDRLSMLRSVVPKISKMDRTSILGDTIDYMKELLERINSLQRQEEGDIGGAIFNENILVRNSPKMEVERGDGGDTRINMCCAMKPGLLLSTMNAVEVELGLEIRQCVISCFSDFTMQASCSQPQATTAHGSAEGDAEDIKQVLFRNAAGISLTSTFV